MKIYNKQQGRKAAVLQKTFSSLLPALFVFWAILSGGCVQQNNTANHVTPPVPTGPQLSFFLNLQESEVPDLQLQLASIEILSAKGDWKVIEASRHNLSAKEIGNRQVFINRSVMQPGNYSRLRLIFEKAFDKTEQGENKPLELLETSVELEIRNPLFFKEGDSMALFLTWDVKQSLPETGGVRPSFQLAPKLKHMLADTAFVACPDINTIFMVRTDKNRVYDSLGVGNRPMYLFRTNRPNDDIVYALPGNAAEVKIMSASANRIVENYRLPMTGKATFMALDSNGTWGYIVDRDRGDILKMEMNSGNIVQRLYLGVHPSYVIYLKKNNQLAVSLTGAQSVVFLDAGTLSQVGSITTGSGPDGLFNSLDDKWLYIAESDSNTVMVYNLEDGTESARIPVGFKPRRILAKGFSVYVTNYKSNSISILKPRQLAVSRTIQLSGRPAEIMTVPRSNWIYVGNEDENAINVIDPNTSRVVDTIELGARPKGMTVMN